MLEHTIYKPNRNINGGAASLNTHKSGSWVFLKMATQIGPPAERVAGGEKQKVFDWSDEGSINVKMGITDLCEMLSVINGRKTEAKLFHQTERDNKMIDFKHVPDKGIFGIRVSHKIGDGQPKAVAIPISYGEAEALKVFFEESLITMMTKGDIAP